MTATLPSSSSSSSSSSSIDWQHEYDRQLRQEQDAAFSDAIEKDRMQQKKRQQIQLLTTRKNKILSKNRDKLKNKVEQKSKLLEAQALTATVPKIKVAFRLPNTVSIKGKIVGEFDALHTTVSDVMDYVQHQEIFSLDTTFELSFSGLNSSDSASGGSGRFIRNTSWMKTCNKIEDALQVYAINENTDIDIDIDTNTTDSVKEDDDSPTLASLGITTNVIAYVF